MYRNIKIPNLFKTEILSSPSLDEESRLERIFVPRTFFYTKQHSGTDTMIYMINTGCLNNKSKIWRSHSSGLSG